MPRWLRSVLAAIAVVYAVYLVAANIILRTHLLRHWLSTDENALRIDYASARSLFPGSVVVHDLRIRLQDDNLQMLVALDRASLNIDLWKLTQRIAHFENVRAEGVVYRMRMKEDTPSGNEGRIAAFPPIEGYSDPPLKQVPPPQTDASRPWTIEIRDVQASVREVWTMECRFRGDAFVAGGFHIEPGHQAYVTPSFMRARDGLLSFGDRDLIRGGEWSLEAQIDPFEPQAPKGIEVFRYMSFTVHEHGGGVSVASIGETYLPTGSKTTFEGGGGMLSIDIYVDHGVLRPNTRVTYESDDVVLRSPPFVLKNKVNILARVDDGHLMAEASVPEASLVPAADIREVRGDVRFEGVDIAVPLALSSMSGAVTSVRVQDLRAWQAVAGDAAKFDGGAVIFGARGDYHHGALDGHIDATLDKVAMTIGPFAFVTSGTTSSNIASKDVAKDIAFPAARVDAHDLSIRLLDGHAKGMWLRARSEDPRVATSGKTAADADVTVESGPGDQTLKLFTRLASLPDVSADLAHGSRLDASVHLRVRHDEIGVSVLSARNGALQGRGRLRKVDGQEATGAFLLSLGPISVGLDIAHGNVSVRPLSSGAWLAETLPKR